VPRLIRGCGGGAVVRSSPIVSRVRRQARSAQWERIVVGEKGEKGTPYFFACRCGIIHAVPFSLPRKEVRSRIRQKDSHFIRPRDRRAPPWGPCSDRRASRLAHCALARSNPSGSPPTARQSPASAPSHAGTCYPRSLTPPSASAADTTPDPPPSPSAPVTAPPTPPPPDA